ncbi:molybdopterin converting factor subunit 1 [Alteromonas lipolytica]|uniref:Molybdopterin synthase sulfur carrier subunit n=1 Tax=Alteromonas lipolytica TaxID=1856405 RepID=A0A1E8FH13_9ALTE|nr:molybdopterin converting factor subunit 1 [Alteromonas lipolytica]OFI34888.1 molybdopterin converting factor subunit 1 [Alteromonas lipolytica]GGF54861.1 molybdopterin synthase sulfur carrier subunit [Alteromonas lipolytica]
MKVKFFAQIRELTGCDAMELAVPDNATVDGVREQLMQQGEVWREALSANVLSARNQTLCNGSTAVCEDDEIAFFPPVTGG